MRRRLMQVAIVLVIFGSASAPLAEDKARAIDALLSRYHDIGAFNGAALVAERGTVILKSTVHVAVWLDTAPVVVNEISVIGSRCGPFEPALELLRTGRVRVDDLISARYALEDAPRAFRHAARRGTRKVLLLP